MKITQTACLAASLIFLPNSYSGEPPVVDLSPIAIDESLPIDVTFTMPGWAAGIDGTIGVKGLETGVSAGIDDIVKNLDMIGAGQLEVRRGKLGFLIDGLYIKASVGGDTPGPLLSNVSVGVEQVIAEATLLYRVHESDRGWIDFLAGARYFYLGNTLNLTVDGAGVRNVSQELGARVVDRAVTAARDVVNEQLPTVLADLRDQATVAIQDRVEERVDEVRQAIRDRIDQGIGGSGPGIGDGIAGSGPIRDAIKDYARAAAEAKIEGARAEASAAVAAARAKIRDKVEKRLAKAEANLAKTLEKEINRRIPQSEIAASKSWVDPFVGIRARYNLCDDWYAAFRGDIGGFGISSDLTWNLFAAVGYQLNERTTLELGYRYLSIDYSRGGFTYDVATKGPFMGVGITF